ncbi:hypothetical protein GCM10007928_02350 [Sulfitobacter porphyrae]|nr:hypothetical protein GCM10007928_02350 [Sulfitobacter porphyrae]
MAKNYSKGAKRRAKKTPVGGEGLGLEETPKREKNGRPSRRGRDRDPGIETLKARCRLMGKEVTAKNISEVRAPWWGCYAGRILGDRTMDAADRADLWSAICHMRKVVTQHDAAIGLPKRHAACMRLLQDSVVIGRVEDTRTDEERVSRASAALMKVEGWLGYTDTRSRSEAKRVVLHDEVCVDPDGLILALRCVSDGIKGKRLSYRGRREG